MPKATRQRGFLLIDIFMGLSVIVILLGVVGMTMVQTGTAAQSLANHRQAVREAERAMLNLQQGGPTEHDVERLGATAPQGMMWVRVKVTVEARQAQLIGLVPLEASP